MSDKELFRTVCFCTDAPAGPSYTTLAMARRVTRLYHYVHWEDPERGRRGIHQQPSRRMAVGALSLRAVGCNVLEVSAATRNCM